MALARKSKRGWSSSKTKLQARNTQGDRQKLKMKGYDGVRHYWAPVLTRGKLHIEVFDSDFPGECPTGAAKLVEKVRVGVNKRFQQEDSKPDVVFTDRGRGDATRLAPSALIIGQELAPLARLLTGKTTVSSA